MLSRLSISGRDISFVITWATAIATCGTCNGVNHDHESQHMRDPMSKPVNYVCGVLQILTCSSVLLVPIYRLIMSLICVKQVALC